MYGLTQCSMAGIPYSPVVSYNHPSRGLNDKITYSHIDTWYTTTTYDKGSTSPPHLEVGDVGT